MNRWIFVLVFALLAAGRWFIMSSPAHFMGWMPSAWFRGEALFITQQSLNGACSWLFLVMIPALGYWLVGYRQASFVSIMHDGFLLGKPIRVSRYAYLTIVCLQFGAMVLGWIATALIPSLRVTYPLMHSAEYGLGKLLLSSSLTFGLILATELFYRGVALSILNRRFGIWAVYLLTPIYVLDHFGAPVEELIGSGFVAILLGHLALRVKSIWPGFSIHFGCALMVDISSLVWSERLKLF